VYDCLIKAKWPMLLGGGGNDEGKTQAFPHPGLIGFIIISVVFIVII
jgi:hypothetical protein